MSDLDIMVAAIERVMDRIAEVAPRYRVAGEQHDLLGAIRQALLEIMTEERPQ